jgi:hypothetical protein
LADLGFRAGRFSLAAQFHVAPLVNEGHDIKGTLIGGGLAACWRSRELGGLALVLAGCVVGEGGQLSIPALHGALYGGRTAGFGRIGVRAELEIPIGSHAFARAAAELGAIAGQAFVFESVAPVGHVLAGVGFLF